jgi:PhnB protein
MAKKVNPIPAGFHTVTPSLIVRGADQAIDFYKRAFGAQEISRMAGPDGKKIMHAELKIGDSYIFLGDEHPEMGTRSPQTLGGVSGGLNLNLENVDNAFKRAVDAGATVRMQVSDMFWGDRYGKIVDPFGYEWGLATHIEDVSHEEMARRSVQAMKQFAKAQSAWFF